MAQNKNKNLAIKNKSGDFDIEEEFKDTNRPNAKASEPARELKKPSSIDKEKAKHVGVGKRV